MELEKANDEGENLDGGNKVVPDDLEPPSPILGINKDDPDNSDNGRTNHLARGEIERDFVFLGFEEVRRA